MHVPVLKLWDTLLAKSFVMWLGLQFMYISFLFQVYGCEQS